MVLQAIGDPALTWSAITGSTARAPRPAVKTPGAARLPAAPEDRRARACTAAAPAPGPGRNPAWYAR